MSGSHAALLPPKRGVGSELPCLEIAASFGSQVAVGGARAKASSARFESTRKPHRGRHLRMATFQTSAWPEIEALRERVMKTNAGSVEEAAQDFALAFASQYTSVVLARVFLVLPWAKLPAPERETVSSLAQASKRLFDNTPVLTLLGTAGRETAWRDRTLSQGHRAIPLLDASHVQGIPMVAKLLADLEVDFSSLDQGSAVETRRLMGGHNGAFFVPDARETRDATGRHVIPSRDFVDQYAVRTVLGMGGAYADDTLAVTVIFTDEVIERLSAGRFASLISNFKMATAAALRSGRIFRAN